MEAAGNEVSVQRRVTYQVDLNDHVLVCRIVIERFPEGWIADRVDISYSVTHPERRKITIEEHWDYSDGKFEWRGVEAS